MSGTLYVVATPIGNLDDLTPRACRTLSVVDLVAAEDTRRTGRLLMHIGCKPRLLPLHDHNEQQAVAGIVRRLEAGEDVAVVSDAGTPLISDPGFRLVRAAHRAGVRVVPLPGPCAALAALSAAGLPTDRFCFEGFPPAKRAARLEWLKRLQFETRTMVFYESVHRIADCVRDMVSVFGGDREAFIGREITKLHEQCTSDTLEGLSGGLAGDAIPEKGEFVIVVEGTDRTEVAFPDVDNLLLELSGVLSARDAAALAARVTGGRKNALYHRLLTLNE